MLRCEICDKPKAWPAQAKTEAGAADCRAIGSLVEDRMRYASVSPNLKTSRAHAAPVRRAPTRALSPATLSNQALLRRLQAKPSVGPVNDPLEREADAVAEKVTRMPSPAVASSVSPLQISRKCAECEEEAGKLQTKPVTMTGDGAGEAPASVHEVLRSPGQPLDAATRAFMEPRFGQDFSQVRVHSDGQASASTKAVGALAYTVGSHVVFSPGGYAPHTASGGRLLAHELAHVVQQSADSRRLQRQSEPAGGEPPQNIGQPAANLRQDSSCDNPGALPITETFPAHTTATIYSPPFHAAAGGTINIDLAAELDQVGKPELGTVGVQVFQCCSVSDSEIKEQVIGSIGMPGQPVHTKVSVKLSDQCTLSTKSGNDFVYYLRLRIASQLQAVKLSYSVS
jgi:hypothetical protein